MNTLVQQLAVARQRFEDAKARRKQLMADFLITPMMLEADYDQEGYEAEMKRALKDVQESALSSFETDGNKKPHEAVSIIITKKFSYDNEDVTAWAIEHEMADLLTPVAKKVKALAKTDVSDIPVLVTEEAGTRIKSDLSEYLEED